MQKTPSQLQDYKVEVPPECGRDVHLQRVAITLTHEFCTAPLLDHLKGCVKIVAIVCEEAVVSRGDQTVFIDFGEESDILNAVVTEGDGIIRPVHFRERNYVDGILPRSMVPYRVWMRSDIVSEGNIVLRHAPELRGCTDIRRGARIEQGRNGQEYYAVTYEKEGDKILCPLGYIDRLIQTTSKDAKKIARDERAVRCDWDGKLRKGTLIPKVDGDSLIKKIERWTADPRKLVNLDTFRIYGYSVEKPWSLCLMLLICYSTKI
jgi:hypothetical protein